MTQLKQELRSSRMDISHLVGVLSTGKIMSRLDKKIKFLLSIGNSNTLLDLLKLKRHQVSLVLMESNQTVLFKESLVIAGSWQQLLQ
jgi:hypothetical protein